ncbi:sigma factor-like helix-turn-helix DNA-binding protein [Mesorhizobium sp. LNHC209A00]|uniref:sigma factor-like helix-turn-helix DNA-binding protein n=1 Tax=Mesorhizobium australicum TaxID=536018 RepID=UPI0003D0622D|nr:hypothetical protein X738_27155 [Mesorhizobium sp. LNHC209A00]
MHRFIRNRRTRHAAEAFYGGDDMVQPVEPAGPGAGRAIERLVVHLPPKERACVLLKDVFDHSLEEIAELVGSTPAASSRRSAAAAPNSPLYPRNRPRRRHTIPNWSGCLIAMSRSSTPGTGTACAR